MQRFQQRFNRPQKQPMRQCRDQSNTLVYCINNNKYKQQNETHVDGNVKVQRVERQCFFFSPFFFYKCYFPPAFLFLPLLCETLYTCALTHAHTDTHTHTRARLLMRFEHRQLSRCDKVTKIQGCGLFVCLFLYFQAWSVTIPVLAPQW